MKQYLDLVRHIVDNGYSKDDRTGTGTTSIFGYQMRFDLSKGFPLVTTKRTILRAIIHELIWFLEGSSNTEYLNDNEVHIWDDWAIDGELGPIYGCQWRKWNGIGVRIDQIAEAIETIRTNPDSRRIIVSAWNVSELENMALPPCHILFQFYVINGKLSCQLYQRSADVFLGVPFNIASYAILIHMVAQVTGLEVGDFVYTLGDAHLYNDHKEQVQTLLERKPLPLPKISLNPFCEEIDDFDYESVIIVDYESHPFISAPISV